MIYQKLSEIQKELFVPKNNKNDFGKYNYRSCEDILKTVKPLCEASNCVLFMTNDLVCIGDRNYVEATVKLVDLETGEEAVSKAHAREEEVKKGMDGSQITGAASSYARKYALAGLFSIDNEKDSDATNKGENDTKSEQEKALELAKLKARVLKYINDNKKDFAEVFANYKITDPSQLNEKICKSYINYITKNGDEI